MLQLSQKAGVADKPNAEISAGVAATLNAETQKHYRVLRLSQKAGVAAKPKAETLTGVTAKPNAETLTCATAKPKGGCYS